MRHPAQRARTSRKRRVGPILGTALLLVAAPLFVVPLLLLRLQQDAVEWSTTTQMQRRATITLTTTTTTHRDLYEPYTIVQSSKKSSTAARKDSDSTVIIPRRYEAFQNERNCSISASSPAAARYRALPSKPNVKFVTAKFGYHNKFQIEVMTRRIRALTAFAEWLDEERAFGLYQIPERWQREFPQHTQFLEHPEHESAMGGGWWFWKAVVILEHLETLRDGDLLVYADTDQTTWWPAMTDLLWFMVEHPEYDWALPRWTAGPEYKYTKRDVFVAHCGSSNINEKQLEKAFHSPQWEAGIHIIRNSPKTRQLVQQWLVLSKNYHAISDEPSFLPNPIDFKQHRRDQSLLNMLFKCFYRDGLVFTQVPHKCGWAYERNELHFYFVKLPDKSNDEWMELQNKTASQWAALRNQYELNFVH